MRRIFPALIAVIIAAALSPARAGARDDMRTGNYVGLAFSIARDKQTQRYSFRFTPEGAISMNVPFGGEFTVRPKASFVFDQDGSFRKLDLNIVSQIDALKFEVRPSFVVVPGTGAVGSDSFVLVPSSLMPRIGGIELDRVGKLITDAKSIVSAVDKATKPREDERGETEVACCGPLRTETGATIPPGALNVLPALAPDPGAPGSPKAGWQPYEPGWMEIFEVRRAWLEWQKDHWAPVKGP